MEKNILNSGKEIFEELSSIQDILLDLGITSEEYYNALTISNRVFYM